MNEVTVAINNRPFPDVTLHPDFTEKNEDFYRLYENAFGTDSSIDEDLYGKGHSLFAFSLNSNENDLRTPNQVGQLTIMGTFQNPLPNNVIMVILGYFSKQLKIDWSGNVTILNTN